MWKLSRYEKLDHLVLPKYGHGGDIISRVKVGYFESMIDGVYTRSKGKTGVEKDIAAIRAAVPLEELTLGSLSVATRNGDTSNSSAILAKMLPEELIKYTGNDRSIIATRNKRILAKYIKDDKIISSSAEMGIGDLLNNMYVGAKKGIVGMEVAAKDVAVLIDAAPVKDLTLPVLKFASEHGDTPNAILIAEKMPYKELSQYEGEDHAITKVKNKRSEKEIIPDSVQAIKPVEKSKEHGLA